MSEAARDPFKRRWKPHGNAKPVRARSPTVRAIFTAAETLGVRDKEFAAGLGIPVYTLCDYKSGRLQVKIETVEKMVMFLDIKMDIRDQVLKAEAKQGVVRNDRHVSMGN